MTQKIVKEITAKFEDEDDEEFFAELPRPPSVDDSDLHPPPIDSDLHPPTPSVDVCDPPPIDHLNYLPQQITQCCPF